jgi:hypothetical protein
MLEMMGKLAFNTNVIKWEMVQLFSVTLFQCDGNIVWPYLKNNCGPQK